MCCWAGRFGYRSSPRRRSCCATSLLVAYRRPSTMRCCSSSSSWRHCYHSPSSVSTRSAVGRDCKTRYPPDRCHPGPAMNSADSLTTYSLSSASCSVSDSCSRSATGPPTLLRYNAHSPPSHCPPHGARRSSAPSRRYSSPSSW
ncbi:Uncharacterised protein [Mycobacteroides abscessus subsp. massiliense]|nr:Uncharacterised protein [Mycobacteroides abscessus subsp. massiliense]